MSADSTLGPLNTALTPGLVLDGFRLIARLHQGGMANLWSVTREEPLEGEDFPLIMKVPRIKGGEDPATIVGFEVEQMLMPSLSGPHVPRFVARGDWTRQAYIVMEAVPGFSLRPRLDEAPLPLDDVVDIGVRVALALHALHRQHVIHLDVKPSNIMFRPDGTAVLVDFGLSRHEHLPDLLEEEFTLPMGTGPYMSPEQVQFVRNDPRSDLFALGVMLYHLSTGQRPFGAPDSVRGLRQRLYTEPIPPRVHNPAIPPWMQEIILRCLEVDPERRHPSAAQLALDLRQPLGVQLTARANKLKTRGGLSQMRRWFNSLGAEPRTAPATEQLARSPITMVAIDFENASPALLEQMLDAARRAVLTSPGARLACVDVLKTARLGMDELTDSKGQSKHVKQLVALRHWARPLAQMLQLEDSRLTFHVLEAPDAADALLDFAARSGADHIIMGARGTSSSPHPLGSVTSQVLAQAECSVTVVRVKKV
ncbi:MAG TPA: bifunctional serine/threonine-protein kinase/universal stress protein [Burkholderiaceae bacterium]|jgi:protein-serine/threonine kinase